MGIETLRISDLRNIEKTKLSISSGINLIIGENASGKSSLLEAIHLLFLSKSFRTGSSETIIRNGQSRFQIVAQIRDKQQSVTLGIEKQKKLTKIKYAGKSIGSAAKLARIQPLVLLTPETHQIILGGPSKRRKLIDWLLFHVEHSYYKNWQGYNKILKQRNVLLRKRKGGDELAVWDAKIVDAANILEKQRVKTVTKLIYKLEKRVEQYCEFPIELRYERGWGCQEYSDVIKQGREKDLMVGYTRKGPHRTDLLITTNGQSAAQILSRGQTKHLAIALEVSKINLLKEETDQDALILIDDLAAELDSERKKNLAKMLLLLDSQMFITATEKNLLPEEMIQNAKMFHVEHGNIQEVV